MSGTDDQKNTALTDSVKRVELAAKIARSLLLFPLYPQPGCTIEDHAKCLETSYTVEITRLLNEAAKS